MAIANRMFRVFVSSTFEDLIEERNALQRATFPALNKLCESHGARFQAVDLRAFQKPRQVSYIVVCQGFTISGRAVGTITPMKSNERIAAWHMESLVHEQPSRRGKNGEILILDGVEGSIMINSTWLRLESQGACTTRPDGPSRQPCQQTLRRRSWIRALCWPDNIRRS